MKVEKNIQIPPRGYGGTSKYLSLYKSMECGDSVAFTNRKEAVSFNVALRRHIIESDLTTYAKALQRKMPDGTYRVWLVDKRSENNV